MLAHDLLQSLERQFDLGQHLHRVGRAGRRGDRARTRSSGTSMPCAVTIGTTSIEVRLPGMPPMQCLSTTGPRADLVLPVDARGRRRSSPRSGTAPRRGRVRTGWWRRRRPPVRSSSSAPRATSRMIGVTDRRATAARRRSCGAGRRSTAPARHARCCGRGLRPRCSRAKASSLRPRSQVCDDALVVDDVQHRRDGLPVGLHRHLGQRLEARPRARPGIAVQVGHVLAPGVDADPADREGRRRHFSGSTAFRASATHETQGRDPDRFRPLLTFARLDCCHSSCVPVWPAASTDGDRSLLPRPPGDRLRSCPPVSAWRQTPPPLLHCAGHPTPSTGARIAARGEPKSGSL